MMSDRAQDLFNLDRFVKAQSENYEEALAELRAGQKHTHWSWYVLPQIRGLGSSEMSVRYAISGAPEAKAYLSHRVLGPKLLECVAAINAHRSLSAADILGPVDAQKFHSCATLFAEVSADNSPFHVALDKYFSGVRDGNTVAILARQATIETR
jgi:uncharacterized protein (DUF1810 family)